jgi:hypothetical protein
MTASVFSPAREGRGVFGCNFRPKGYHMSEQDTGSGPSKGDLVPQPEKRTELGEIRSAEELLGKAFRALPDEQKQEIVKKAAEEALQLQAKMAHYQVERQEVEERLDLAGRAAGMVQRSPDTEIQYEDEIRRQQGSTRIAVGSKKPEKQGFCFVATACFGDYDHPTVRLLRQFRDTELQRAPFGKTVISLYYRHGRSLASLVDRLPGLKPIVRATLNTFAVVYRSRTRRK